MSIVVHFKHTSVTLVAKHRQCECSKAHGCSQGHMRIYPFFAELLRRLTTSYISDFISLGFLLLSQTGELQRRLGADVAHFLFGRICILHL